MTADEHLLAAIALLESRTHARETPVFATDMKIMREALAHLRAVQAGGGAL